MIKLSRHGCDFKMYIYISTAVTRLLVTVFN